jgi:hypothetical protein
MKFTTPFISDCDISDISVKKELYSHSSHPFGMSYTSEKAKKRENDKNQQYSDIKQKNYNKN